MNGSAVIRTQVVWLGSTTEPPQCINVVRYRPFFTFTDRRTDEKTRELSETKKCPFIMMI